jgi:hypothetical protein
LKPLGLQEDAAAVDELVELTRGYSSAAFAALRSQLKAVSALSGKPLAMKDVAAAVHDQLPADIGSTRRYQTLQALVNCTRRSLLPDPQVDDQTRQAWAEELDAIEP